MEDRFECLPIFPPQTRQSQRVEAAIKKKKKTAGNCNDRQGSREQSARGKDDPSQLISSTTVASEELRQNAGAIETPRW